MIKSRRPFRPSRRDAENPIYDHPVALLKSLDGTEQLVATVDPPPPALEFPVPQRFTIQEGDQSQPVVIHKRVFRRSNFKADEISWWRVFNEGRSRTPERARVYFEVRN